MVSTSIDTVIFDFGGVIINIDYNATIKAFQELGIPKFESLYSQALQSNLFDDIETGRISPDHFIHGLLEHLPENTTEEQVITAWNAMLLDVPLKRIQLLQSLKDKYNIFLLSNTNEIHIEKAYEHWAETSSIHAEEIFKKVYLSHEMGMRKPDAEIFEFVCKEQQLNPANTLFIDDSIQHIEGAQSIGLNTIHLTNGLDIQTVFS